MRTPPARTPPTNLVTEGVHRQRNEIWIADGTVSLSGAEDLGVFDDIPLLKRCRVGSQFRVCSNSAVENQERVTMPGKRAEAAEQIQVDTFGHGRALCVSEIACSKMSSHTSFVTIPTRSVLPFRHRDGALRRAGHRFDVSACAEAAPRPGAAPAANFIADGIARVFVNRTGG